MLTAEVWQDRSVDRDGWSRLAVQGFALESATRVEMRVRRRDPVAPYLDAAGWQEAERWLVLEDVQPHASGFVAAIGPALNRHLVLTTVEVSLRLPGQLEPGRIRVRWPAVVLENLSFDPEATVTLDGSEAEPEPPEPESEPEPEAPPAPEPGAGAPAVAAPAPLPGRRWPLVALAVILVLALAGAGAAYFMGLWDPRGALESALQEGNGADAGSAVVAGATDGANAEPTGSNGGEAEKAPARTYDEDAVRAFLEPDPDAASASAEGDAFVEAGHPGLALLLYRYADRKGDASASRAIGKMYDPALHDSRTSAFPSANPEQAARYYGRAAEAGDAESQYLLGRLHAAAGGDELERGVQWLERAAEQGHAPALEYLKALARDP